MELSLGPCTVDLSVPASRTKTVGVIVRRLRRKIEPAPDQPTILRTIRGKGWTLVADDQPGTPRTPWSCSSPRETRPSPSETSRRSAG